jgi:hypothetical protein
MDGRVLALLSLPDGLLAGGEFTRAGSAAAAHVARWDGAAWQPLGDGTDGPVLALAGYGGAVIAGGDFRYAGGAPAGRIARWDGTAWSSLGAGANGAVTRLFAWGDRLVAAGHFTSMDGVEAQHVAWWNGEAWHALGSGVEAPVLALAHYESRGEDLRYVAGLVLGGLFQEAGEIPSRRIALWQETGTNGRGEGSASVASDPRSAPRDPLGAGLRLVLRPAIDRAASGPVTLAFHLPASGAVELTVHDLLGRRIVTLADGWMPAGEQVRIWEPRGAGTGLYFLRLRAGGQVCNARLLRIE